MSDVAGFDRDTRIAARDDASGYATHLPAHWSSGISINGGLQLAVAARALAQEISATGATGSDGPDAEERERRDRLDPFSVHAFFLSPATPGAAVVTTTTVRRGRTVSIGAASLRQSADGAADPEERLRVTASFRDLERSYGGEVIQAGEPPRMPPPEDCVGTDTIPPAILAIAPMYQQIDIRLDPACAGYLTGRPAKRGLVQAWLRFPDGREPDPLSLLFAADALPSTSFELGIEGFALTMDMTVHVRARPAAGWLRVVHSTRSYTDGFMEEDAEVWDSTDRLVAQSRQMARVVPAQVLPRTL